MFRVLMDFPHNGSLGIKPRKMVKLLRKSFDVSKMRLMFVLKLVMTITSVILNFKKPPMLIYLDRSCVEPTLRNLKPPRNEL